MVQPEYTPFLLLLAFLQTLDGSQIRVREDREDADTQGGRSNDAGRARSSRDSFGSSRGVKVCCSYVCCAHCAASFATMSVSAAGC